MAPVVEPSEMVNLVIALLAVPVLVRMLGTENAHRRKAFDRGGRRGLLTLI